MDTIALFAILCLYVTLYTPITPPTHIPSPSAALKYIRRNAAPSRVPNLIAFSILYVLSLTGAIGLTARGASENGKGLCTDFGEARPKECAQGAVAATFSWIAVVLGTPPTSLALCLVRLTIR